MPPYYSFNTDRGVSINLSIVGNISSLLDEYNDLTDFAEIENLKRPGYCLFLTYTWEIPEDVELFAKTLNNLILKIKQKYPEIVIHVVLDSWFLEEKLDLNVPITYIDFFLLRTCTETKKQQLVPVETWNSNASKFLFLTGKLDKIQRIRLFYKLQQQGLITEKLCEWSLFPNGDLNGANSNRHVPELENSLQEFLKVYARYPDKFSQNTEKLLAGAAQHDIQLFQNSLFRLIPETYFSNNRPFITEKIWDTIFNRLPFIVAGDVNTLGRLKDMGFKTFDQYLITDYDNVTNKEERLNVIVANVAHWLENLKQHKDQINSDIEHNKKRLDELYQKNLTEINKLISNYNLNLTPLDIVDTHAYDTVPFNFKKWYNLRKGSEWPDCQFERDLYSAPDWVKEECKKFGHVFKISL